MILVDLVFFCCIHRCPLLVVEFDFCRCFVMITANIPGQEMKWPRFMLES